MNFLLILSHKKSIVREDQRQKILATNNGKFIFYYFIGDMSLKSDYVVDEPNNIVYLKVPDNYESLSMKTYYAMKFISENYLDKIDGVFKTDDDIELDIDKLFKCISDNKSVQYFGLAVTSPSYDSTYHFGKCESVEMNNKPVSIPIVTYCAGGGYYVSKNVINNVLVSKSVFRDIIFEDVCVGVSMNRYGVYPTNVNIKESGCVWGNVVDNASKRDDGVIVFSVPNKTNVEICRCGELKNRRLSNFCQKCNKLY